MERLRHFNAPHIRKESVLKFLLWPAARSKLVRNTADKQRRPRGGMDRVSVCNFRNATVVGSNPVQDARIFHPQKTTISPFTFI